MGEEGLTGQDRGAGADTGMVVPKNIVGGIKENTRFFAGKLHGNADPFHAHTSAGLFITRDHGTTINFL